MKLKKVIVDYATKLKNENLCGDSGFIFYRKDHSTAYCFDGKFDNVLEENIKVIDYQKDNSLGANILRIKPNINAIMSVSPPKVKVVAKAKVDIPAVLDDMAQIVGVRAKVCKNNDKDILKAIKKANSIIIEDQGAIVTGRTLNEAYTCCMVLEKSATVYISASVIGGCHNISALEAKLMNFVYRIKYSKKNQENVATEES